MWTMIIAFGLLGACGLGLVHCMDRFHRAPTPISGRRWNDIGLCFAAGMVICLVIIIGGGLVAITN